MNLRKQGRNSGPRPSPRRQRPRDAGIVAAARMGSEREWGQSELVPNKAPRPCSRPRFRVRRRNGGTHHSRIAIFMVIPFGHAGRLNSATLSVVLVLMMICLGLSWRQTGCPAGRCCALSRRDRRRPLRDLSGIRQNPSNLFADSADESYAAPIRGPLTSILSPCGGEEGLPALLPLLRYRPCP